MFCWVVFGSEGFMGFKTFAVGPSGNGFLRLLSQGFQGLKALVHGLCSC